MQQERLHNSYNIKHFSFTLSYVVYFEMKKKTGNVIVTYPITEEYLLQTRAHCSPSNNLIPLKQFEI